MEYAVMFPSTQKYPLGNHCNPQIIINPLFKSIQFTWLLFGLNVTIFISSQRTYGSQHLSMPTGYTSRILTKYFVDSLVKH